MHSIPIENILSATRLAKVVRVRSPAGRDTEWSAVEDRDYATKAFNILASSAIRTSSNEVMLISTQCLATLVEFEFVDPAHRRLLDPTKVAPTTLKDMAKQVVVALDKLGVDVGPIRIRFSTSDNRLDAMCEADCVVYTPHGRVEGLIEGRLHFNIEDMRFYPMAAGFLGGSSIHVKGLRGRSTNPADRRKWSSLLPPGCKSDRAFADLTTRIEGVVFDAVTEQCRTVDQPQARAVDIARLPYRRCVEVDGVGKASERVSGERSWFLVSLHAPKDGKDKHTLFDSWDAALEQLGLRPANPVQPE